MRNCFPRLLDTYVARQLPAPAAIVLASFGSMLLVQLLLREATVVFSETATPLAVAQYVLYRVPWFLVFSLPVAMMGATSLALARLIRDRELMAIHMGNVSLKRVALPILLVSFFVAAFSLLANEKIVPWANSRALKAQGRALYHRPYPALPTSRLVFEGEPGLYLYVRLLDPRSGQARDVVCLRLNADGAPQSCLVSPLATITGRTWLLRNVKEYSFEPSGRVKEGITSRADLTLELREDMKTVLGLQASAEQMSSVELRERISALSLGGVEGANELRLAFHRRFSLPVACIILAALMVPLSVRFTGGNSFSSLLLVVFVYFLYNGLMNWAKAVAQADLMNPVLAAWLHDIVFGAVAGVLFIRKG